MNHTIADSLTCTTLHTIPQISFVRHMSNAISTCIYTLTKSKNKCYAYFFIFYLHVSVIKKE